MPLSCAVCGVSLCLVKDARTNRAEREAITHFELGPVHVHSPSPGFHVLVV